MGGPLVDGDSLPQGAMLIVNAQDESEVRRKAEERSLVSAWHSQTGEHQALGNFYRREEIDPTRR